MSRVITAMIAMGERSRYWEYPTGEVQAVVIEAFSVYSTLSFPGRDYSESSAGRT